MAEERLLFQVPEEYQKQIGLHPLATLAALFLGLKLLGLVGLIAFPVALTVLFNFSKEELKGKT